MDLVTTIVMNAVNLFVIVMTLGVGIGILAIGGLYFVDISQTSHAIRRNYPVIGRFRYFFEHMGEFFRQYFFSMDREEMPFNRAQRSYVYRAAKNEDSTTAFGSTRDLRAIGAVSFVNCPFPTLEVDAVPTQPLTIGPHCPHPYNAKSLFNISGISFGAISKNAVLALSNGARMAGCWYNTGEGGLSPYHLEGGADIVFQIGTAKYGVRDEQGALCDDKLRQIAAHENVKMFEIKLSQGAKPGKGGILPGKKVTPEISRIRGIPEGEDSISPNRHPEIENNHDLLEMISRIRSVTGKPVGIKFVLGAYGWLETLFDDINEAGIECAPDFITIDSADGGTGAAPTSLIDYVGIPLHESLTMVVDMLSKAGLKDTVRVICSGKMITPGDVAWALCMGADFCVSARGFMFALGCIQALQCNKDTCPTGIATHNRKLQRGLDPDNKALRVANYVRNLVHETEVIAHSCGVREPRRLQRMHARVVVGDGKSYGLDQVYPEKPVFSVVAGVNDKRVPLNG